MQPAPQNTHMPHAAFKSAKTAWILSDGTKGMEVQSLGLAARMGLDFSVIHLGTTHPVSRLAHLALLPFMPLPQVLRDCTATGWPDLIITTGRRMAGYSILLRRHGKGKTRTIHIQDPKISPHHFDCMIVPKHDNARGANVITTIGSLNALTDAKIIAAAKTLPKAITAMQKPLCVFMLGGSNRRYRVGGADYEKLGAFAAEFANAKNTGLAFIPSRRSAEDAAAAIRTALKKTPHYIWDGTGANPYPGILARADMIVVTGDSVNMISEACFTQKPVFVYHFREETGRIASFHKIMESHGFIMSAEAMLTQKPHNRKRLDETGRVAEFLTGRAP